MIISHYATKRTISLEEIDLSNGIIQLIRVNVVARKEY